MSDPMARTVFLAAGLITVLGPTITLALGLKNQHRLGFALLPFLAIATMVMLLLSVRVLN